MVREGTRKCLFFWPFSLIRNLCISVASNLLFEDESSNPYGQIARNLEPNDALELSPVATNVESVEAALQDEIDDDDPFSKRR